MRCITFLLIFKVLIMAR